jgi:hypothetical protein
MGKIARLLDEPEKIVDNLLDTLEGKNGYPSHDARYLAQNVQKVRAKLHDLGLDPDDTTAEELYHALLVKYQNDSRDFDESFDAADMVLDGRLATAAALVTKNVTIPEQWALKNSAVKALLRQLPPKHVMKHLRYRSVESLLKRENMCEVMLAAQNMESARWRNDLHHKISRLSPADFEFRPLKILALSSDKWGGLDGENYIAASDEMAVFGLWPALAADMPLLTMTIKLMERLGSYNELKLSYELSHLHGMISWWADMDHLIADLSGGHVSLNLLDVAAAAHTSMPFHERSLRQVRQSFWQALVEKYENLPKEVIESTFEKNHSRPVINIPQPSFEFAEEFDG